jgi:hypothetical protein
MEAARVTQSTFPKNQHPAPAEYCRFRATEGTPLSGLFVAARGGVFEWARLPQCAALSGLPDRLLPASLRSDCKTVKTRGEAQAKTEEKESNSK